MPPVAILDIDGTLVDSNYQHAIAWYRALREHGLVLPLWRIHRAIGMGGDQMIGALCGDEVEERLGDDVRAAEKEHYSGLIEEVQPLEGARGLIEDLKERGCVVIMASSAKPEETEHYLDLLDARDLTDGWTTSGDVDSTKPQPDLVRVAMDKAGMDEADGREAVMVGDSRWDIEAAKRAGVETLAVRTGGFGEDELLAAGAHAVYESIVELREGMPSTPFG